MRYFTYMAEQAFKTSAKGERLFYRGGPCSRPFIIPDADTEQRLYGKQVWMLRFLLGALIVGQPILFMLHPEVPSEPFWFLAYFVFVMALFWIVGRIVFARDLRSMERASGRLRPSAYYGQMAQQHSPEGLFLGFMGSLLFVAGGVWMLSVRANLAAAILCVSFFGICAVAWGYALFVKLQTGKSPDKSDEIQ